MSTAGLRTVFLLGAGSSVPANMPSTQEITDRVLSGESVVYGSDDTYGLQAEDGVVPNVSQRLQRQVYVEPVVEYLNHLRDCACDYYTKHRGRVPNYEDLYYVAAQVRDARLRALANPLVHKESEAIFQKLERREQCRAKRLDGCTCLPAAAVLDKALTYVEGVVRDLLAKEPAKTDHLGMIAAARRDQKRVQSVDVATLNHDRVIDTFLKVNEIDCADGFRKPAGKDGFRLFCPDVYDQRNVLRVFKLHGAANWTWLWKANDWWGSRIVIFTDPCAMDRLRPSDYQQDDLPIQIGTYNKIMNYTFYRHLSDLQCQFLHCLDNACQWRWQNDPIIAV
jgi:hypothetical protein